MADVTIKRIDQLPAASTPQGTDLLPLWQGTQTTKVPLSNIQAAGPAGKDGVSPTVEVSKSGTQTTITITDAQGKHTATINDGAPGKDGTPGTPGKDGGKGDPGEDGVSPTVSINKVGKTTTITITDKQGAHVATIEDGADGEGGGGSAYTLPVASAETLGGVKAKAKTDAETVEVAVDKEGKLYVPAASSGGGDSYTLPVAGKSALGGVKWASTQKQPITSMLEPAAGFASAPGLITDSGAILVPVVGSTIGTDVESGWQIGAVMGNGEKTDEDTIPVHHDALGKLWVKPSGGGGSSEALTMTLNVEIKGGTSAAVTVTAQSIPRMLRVGDVIDTTLTITDNEYLIGSQSQLWDAPIFFDRAYGVVRAVGEDHDGKQDIAIVFTAYSTSSLRGYSADVTSYMFLQATDGYALEVASLFSPALHYLLTPWTIEVSLDGALPLSGTALRMCYQRGGAGVVVYKDTDGTEIMSTRASANGLSVLALPLADGFWMLTDTNIRLQVVSGTLIYTSEAGSGNGVSLYVVNQTVGNVDFSRYKAGDVVLLVQDLVVTKEE